ncbi:S9 family peptidase [Anaerobacillus sp. CMMVII]|uniref:alpha/beta hydrolase family protein n=1 Tax=Anaerobacillus sp. CMMVII TaxID=2755588 RepID=UPI0021B75411|nr:prolyl oligopeptidase family serine peptidase [Anaerobacillus sp. CMMVII]MCT8137199.1 S9 family peptidase [Anaerobacillus sp. CMMVII]
MIYKVSYMADGLNVKGYLGFPNEIHVTKQEITELFNDLPVEEVASSIVSNRVLLGEGKWPAFIYCRGGIGRIGRVKPSWVEAFAKQGYIVFAPCYRGHEGGEGRDEFGGADTEDVHSAFRLLESFSFVDKKKISIMGFSRGAINATLTSIVMPSIHRLVLWGGVSCLRQTYEERIDLRRMLKRVIGGSPNKLPLAYHLRSPIEFAKDINCPVLIIHGTTDSQVDVSHGVNMYEQLNLYSKKTTIHLYEGYGHHLPFDVHHDAIRKMFSWIEDKY